MLQPKQFQFFFSQNPQNYGAIFKELSKGEKYATLFWPIKTNSFSCNQYQCKAKTKSNLTYARFSRPWYPRFGFPRILFRVLIGSLLYLVCCDWSDGVTTAIRKFLYHGCKCNFPGRITRMFQKNYRRAS